MEIVGYVVLYSTMLKLQSKLNINRGKAESNLRIREPYRLLGPRIVLFGRNRPNSELAGKSQGLKDCSSYAKL
jgi:hypothetical protein